MTARQGVFCCDRTTNRQLSKNGTHGVRRGRRLFFYSDAVLRLKTAVMDDNFDRAPGAGRSRNVPTEPGLMGTAGEIETKTALFNQREPLRQPRTAPPFTDNNISTANDIGTGGRRLPIDQQPSSVAETPQLIATYRIDLTYFDLFRHTYHRLLTRILQFSKSFRFPVHPGSKGI